MTTVSIFRNSQLTTNRSLSTILNHIRQGTDKELVENYRQLLRDGKDDWADQLLLHMQHFTPAGCYLATRTIDNLMHYTRLVMLEARPMRESEIEETKKAVIKEQYTFACFRNLAGNALVVLVPVETEAHQHLRTYNRVHQYFSETVGLSLTSAGFRVTDVCFHSYDPDAFIDLDAMPFPLQPPPAAFPPASNAVALPATVAAVVFA
jgi:hypothetical protein